MVARGIPLSFIPRLLANQTLYDWIGVFHSLSGNTSKKETLLQPRVLFGSRQAVLRPAKGWSQGKFSRPAGSQLGRVKRRWRNITLLNICKLAEALGAKPSLLMQPRE